MFEKTDDSRKRLLILAGIILASVVIRLITAEYIDIGGDNSEKLRQAHYLIEGLGYTQWYQQTGRWGIMLPLAGLMKLLGANPIIAYIQPIFYSTLAAACLFLIGDRLQERTLGIVAAGATILFPQMAQTGSQLWPGVFELGYLSLCVWLILVWLDTRKPVILLLAATIFFLGWGCRVTMIYAAPGLALLIWLPSRNFKALLLFFFPLVGFFLLEWSIFSMVTSYPLGRLGIIKATHLQTAGLGLSFQEYILNIAKLVKLKGLMPVWALCFLAAVRMAVTGDARWRALGLFYALYAILLLYMVSSLSPLKLAMPVGTRFWGVIAPFGLLLVVKCLFDLARTRPRTARWPLGALFLIFLVFTVKKIPPVNSLVQLNRDYQLLEPILAARKPVLMEYEHWQPNFMEEHVISMFTGKGGKRIPREDHVQAAIVRNHHRMVALFVTDLSLHDSYKMDERMTRVDYTTFLFTPPGAAPDAKPAAKIYFGRKLHRAVLLP
jgi:hypothetical protein